MYTHICKRCKKMVITKNRDQKFCSISCSSSFNCENGKKPPIGNRKGCHLTAEHKEKLSKAHMGLPSPSPWMQPERKNESLIILKRMWDKNRGSKKTEEVRKKMSLSMIGKNIKHGKTKENAKIRASIESRLWREAVFARDNFTCCLCQQRGGRLHPHHIKSFAEYPELRFAIDNGETLCISCHAKQHKEIGFFKNRMLPDENYDMLVEG